MPSERTLWKAACLTQAATIPGLLSLPSYCTSLGCPSGSPGGSGCALALSSSPGSGRLCLWRTAAMSAPQVCGNSREELAAHWDPDGGEAAPL